MRGLVHRHRQGGFAIYLAVSSTFFSKHEVYMQVWHFLAVANSPLGRTAVQILQIATIDRFSNPAMQLHSLGGAQSFDV